MNAHIERAFRNRWIGGFSAITIGYIALRVAFYVVTGAYDAYYRYPLLKGTEYNYPQIRYALGQAAIFVWSCVGLSGSVLLWRAVIWRTDTKWAARTVVAFVAGVPILLFGLIAGMAMRDFGWLP